jgi:hypothetical protein
MRTAMLPLFCGATFICQSALAGEDLALRLSKGLCYDNGMKVEFGPGNAYHTNRGWEGTYRLLYWGAEYPRGVEYTRTKYNGKPLTPPAVKQNEMAWNGNNFIENFDNNHVTGALCRN